MSGLNDLEAGILQHVDERHPHERLVFDDEDKGTRVVIRARHA
jgi:hypothetical protein